MSKMAQMSVRVQDVWKTYDGKRDVLKGVTLKIPQSKIVLFEGRSGSGKTTLLNLIGCIDVPSRGNIYLNGYNTSELDGDKLADVRLREIGIVFQSHNLISDLTIEENVQLPLIIAKDKKAESRAGELLETFEILKLKGARPDEVSFGERQRVAIARALANNPSILLADEPTASLDTENCDIVMNSFQKANELFGTTVVIASHDSMVRDYVDEKFSLRDGILDQV